MLRVDYKKPLGYKIIKQDGKKFKIHLCHANCLWAEMYFYKNEEGEKMVQLHSFIMDKKHLQNLVKNFPKMYDEVEKIVFVRKNFNEYDHANIASVLPILMKLNVKIEIV